METERLLLLSELRKAQSEVQKNKDHANRLTIEQNDLHRAIHSIRLTETIISEQSSELNEEIASLAESVELKRTLKEKFQEEAMRTAEQRQGLERTWHLLGGKEGLELLEANRKKNLKKSCKEENNNNNEDSFLNTNKNNNNNGENHVDCDAYDAPTREETEMEKRQRIRITDSSGHTSRLSSVCSNDSISSNSFNVRDLFERHCSRIRIHHGMDDTSSDNTFEGSFIRRSMNSEKRSSRQVQSSSFLLLDQGIESVQACLWDEDKSTTVPTSEVETTEDDWNENIEVLRQRRACPEWANFSMENDPYAAEDSVPSLSMIDDGESSSSHQRESNDLVGNDVTIRENFNNNNSSNNNNHATMPIKDRSYYSPSTPSTSTSFLTSSSTLSSSTVSPSSSSILTRKSILNGNTNDVSAPTLPFSPFNNTVRNFMVGLRKETT